MGEKMKTYKSAPRFDAVMRFSGEPVPGPIPDELKIKVRKRRST
jgi:hypothetical protein